jgi:hypothetical protein
MDFKNSHLTSVGPIKGSCVTAERIVVHEEGECLPKAARASRMIPLFVLPSTILVALAKSTIGDQHFYEIVTLCRPPPHQDWGRARTPRFARDDKETGPRWGKQLPGERPRETAET